MSSLCSRYKSESCLISTASSTVLFFCGLRYAKALSYFLFFGRPVLFLLSFCSFDFVVVVVVNNKAVDYIYAVIRKKVPLMRHVADL